jgi:uncharacterized protein (DUF885 family)
VVVDTGMHYEKWSREQAVSWMVQHAGEQREATEREVARYAVYPGQACSFKVGEERIVAAREAARQTRGTAFDIASFHNLILASGPAPIAVIEAAIANWAKSSR